MGSKFTLASMAIALVLIMACLISNAAAQSCSGCTQSSCPYMQEWNANNFLDDTPTETSPSASEENAVKNSDRSNSSIDVQSLSINLKNASATPNPVISGQPVRITAILNGNSTGLNANKTMVYAIIQNSIGIQVGNVALERASDDEYNGIWNASIATGTYRAAITASAPGVSRTFNNALQIEITGSDNATGKTLAYKKLG
jgi:hypothetical protein